MVLNRPTGAPHLIQMNARDAVVHGADSVKMKIMKTPGLIRLAPPVALVVLLAACAALAGCGGGGGDSTASTSGAEARSRSATNTTTSAPKGSKHSGGSKSKSGGGSSEPGPESGGVLRHHHDSGGGAAQFRVKGGDNSVQEFGEEASNSELQSAAAALHGFLDARAAKDWVAACSYLAGSVTESLQQLAAHAKQLQGKGCPELLEALSGGVPASTLAEAAQADVGSLRVEGDRGFILYRGVHNVVYGVSMAREGGAWKVASLSGTPLN